MQEYSIFNFRREDEHRFPLAPSSREGFQIVRVAKEFWAEFHFARRDIPNQMIGLIAGGSVLYGVKKQVELKRGMFFSHEARTPFKVRVLPGKSLEIFILACTGPRASELTMKYFGKRGILGSLTNAAEVQLIYEQMLQDAKWGSRFAYSLCLHQLHVLLCKAAMGLDEQTSRWKRSLSTFRQCLRYIHAHAEDLCRISDVAQACHTDPSNLWRLFKHYQKTSPYEYMLRLKLNKAADLLLTRDITVKEVAAQLHFSDPYTFSRAFKRIIGISPQHYRNRDVARTRAGSSL